jgi:hypothetical protein
LRGDGHEHDQDRRGLSHGYYFRILTGQGVDTPEGARSYIVDEDGIVFQKDLGHRTAAVASATKLFDPDLRWAEVKILNQDPVAGVG